MAGRNTKPRTETVGRTTSSAALTGATGTFQTNDVGKPIVGTGIPAAATIQAVASSTAATLSANATTTTSGAVTIGAGTPSAMAAATQLAGFTGWSPETDAEAATYSVASVNAGQITPDRVTVPNAQAGYLTRRVES